MIQNIKAYLALDPAVGNATGSSHLLQDLYQYC